MNESALRTTQERQQESHEALALEVKWQSVSAPNHSVWEAACVVSPENVEGESCGCRFQLTRAELFVNGDSSMCFSSVVLFWVWLSVLIRKQEVDHLNWGDPRLSASRGIGSF